MPNFANSSFVVEPIETHEYMMGASMGGKRIPERKRGY